MIRRRTRTEAGTTAIVPAAFVSRGAAAQQALSVLAAAPAAGYSVPQVTPIPHSGDDSMMRLLGVLLAAGAVLAIAADDKKDDAAKDELKKFEGTWQRVAGEH